LIKKQNKHYNTTSMYNYNAS